jgi:pyrroline-5-carboxylate reductase
MMRIGFIGCGKIAEPMIRSIARRFPDARISVSKRSDEISSRLESQFDYVTVGDNQWVLDQSDIIVLSVLADVARQLFPDLHFRENQKTISVMADISLAEVSVLISPAHNPCVTIPLPFIETGNCPLPVYPDSELLERVFGDENPIILLQSENHMGPHFAATAILSSLMAQLNCAGNWLGNKTGSLENGEIYVASLVSGYLNTVPKDGNGRFLEVMHELSTEGGLNTQLLNHNRSAGMLETLDAGFEALDERLRGNN